MLGISPRGWISRSELILYGQKEEAGKTNVSLGTKQPNGVLEVEGRGRKTAARERGDLHLIDLHATFLYGNGRAPSCEGTLPLQVHANIFQNLVCIFILARRLYLAMGIGPTG